MRVIELSNARQVMSSERNVVILGKVGAGKKTLGNHIFDKDKFQRESILGARNVGFHFEEHMRGDRHFRILTVDTESLQNSYNKPLPLIQKHFQAIHLIIFVIANGRYTNESHSSLMQAVKSLPGANPFSALVITHCEGITDEERQGIVAEFRSDARTAQIATIIGKEIQTVGFPDITRLPSHLKTIYKAGIAKDQVAIRQLVNRCEHKVSVRDLTVQAKQPFKKHRSLTNEEYPTPYHQPPSEADSLHCQSMEVSDDSQLQTQLGPQSTERTIIMLGKVGSGKKTLGNHIAGKTIFQGGSVIRSRMGDVHNEYREFKRGEIMFRIQIVDTDNFNPLQLKQRTVNSIIFVIVKDDEYQWIKDVVKNLPILAVHNSALLITHCEGLHADKRRDIIARFRTDRSTSHLAAFMGRGVHTVGFPNLSRSSSVKMEDVANDESVLWELVGKYNHPVRLDSLREHTSTPAEGNGSCKSQ